MRTVLFFFTILQFSVSAWAQEVVVQGRVVDAETGEALPYVAIYAGPGRGIMTNVEGEYHLSVSEHEILTFSFIGYEKLHIRASETPKLVKMKALERMLSELVVTPVEEYSILKQVIRNLKRDYSKHKKDQKGYFSRSLLRNEKDSYLIENIMAGRSAVNIRDAVTVSGKSGMNADGEESDMRLKVTNIHRLAEIGARTYQSNYWQDVIKPLESVSKIKKYYKVEVDKLHGNDGERLYRITFKWNDKRTKNLGQRRYLTGKIYVDAKNLRLLRFEGEVDNAYQRVNHLRLPTSIKFNMNYDYTDGYASVSNLSFEGGNEKMKYRSLLFSIQDDSLFTVPSGFSENNILYAVQDAGYDSTLWAKYDIVKRTEEEEAAAFGISSDSSPHKKKKKHAYPKAFRPLIERLDAFGKAIPQEKVYVHMDNTCYFQGDTIWFTAYLKETASGKPSDISGVLYVELLNNDGYLVERKLIEMKEGRGNGFFALNHQIQYSGFYELRAYTRWQLNWGIFEHDHSYVNSLMFMDKEAEEEYYRDYEKLYSRVFPVYDKPAVPGDYTREMTLRVLRRTFKTDMDEKERKPLLTLFPEGGNLVAGVENRVAFEAAMSDGEQLEGTLVFGNDSVKTVNRGRGVFTVVPEKGMEREVTFTSSTGKMVTAKLPKPEEEGVAVQISQEGDSAIVTMNLAGLDPDSLALTVMREGMLEDYKVLSEGLCIKIGGLKPGVHQATVFDTQGRVYADRLFFVTKPDLAEPTLAVSGLQYKNLPYQPVNLSLKASPASGGVKGSFLSVAVRDESQADALFDNGNIMTEMLLSSEVKGFIPNPDWFFEKDDEEHRQALDLLMMTQGWRRFVWRHMAVKRTWDLTQPEERQPIIKGYVRANPYRMSLPSTDDGMLGYIPDSVFFKKEEPGSITKPFSNNKEEPASLKKANQEVKSVDYKPLLALSQKNASGNLIVHAELADADGSNQVVAGEYQLKDGMFKFLCPKYYDNSVFFLSVADEKRLNNRKKKYQWVQMALMEDISPKLMRKLDLDEADYRAYVTWPYPRFVKPYGFYQSHMPQNNKALENGIPLELLDDTVKTMQELEVTAKRRNRLKRFNDAYPAFSVDAYEAWNTIEDAGVPLFNYVNISRAMVRVYMNNYGLPEPPMGEDSRIQLQYGLSPTRRSLPQYIDIPTDSLYHPKYLTSVAKGFDFSPGERREYFGDERVNEDPRFLIDRFVVYTDYQPRHEGSQRYAGANRPETRVAVYPIYDWGRRPIYRDRRYILPGFASPAEFYSPDYSKQTPPEPTDYRRTLYWNPNLKLDENGEATITFFNNSRTTHLSVEAEGQAADGTLLWGKTE